MGRADEANPALVYAHDLCGTVGRDLAEADADKTRVLATVVAALTAEGGVDGTIGRDRVDTMPMRLLAAPKRDSNARYDGR